MTEKALAQLKEKLQACNEQAARLKADIEKNELKGINYEGKILFRKDGTGNDYMIVKRQCKDDDKVCLSGLNFYINNSTKELESAEVFFKGWMTWWYDLNEFLNLEKDKNHKVLDKITFKSEIKGYLKTLEIFISDWIERFISENEIS